MDANFNNLQKTYLLRTSDSRSYRVPNIGMFLKIDSVHLSVLCSFVQLNAHFDSNITAVSSTLVPLRGW